MITMGESIRQIWVNIVACDCSVALQRHLKMHWCFVTIVVCLYGCSVAYVDDSSGMYFLVPAFILDLHAKIKLDYLFNGKPLRR